MRQISPDAPIRSRKRQLLICVVGILSAVSAAIFAALILVRFDLEQALSESMPGYHMPDAFDHLNKAVPMVVALASVSLALLRAVIVSERDVLIVPLFAGPVMCVLGWFVVEDLRDPNWSHLGALSSLGMLVSCVVTSALALTPRKSMKIEQLTCPNCAAKYNAWRGETWSVDAEPPEFDCSGMVLVCDQCNTTGYTLGLGSQSVVCSSIDRALKIHERRLHEKTAHL